MHDIGGTTGAQQRRVGTRLPCIKAPVKCIVNMQCLMPRAFSVTRQPPQSFIEASRGREAPRQNERERGVYKGEGEDRVGDVPALT